ncbi:MAG: EscU/YscU/HrcU family type III secretion system export apparatus switch protein [Sedimentisphaerales bacterium]|nr:EscU/YscU/HrcU family type III secretion system export apparatus switch protein [Sedimentisphaerales bacterium]
MANKPAGERTQHPTARRLSKSRSEGQVPQSQELPSALSLLTLLVLLWFVGPGLLQWFVTQVRGGLSYQPEVFSDTDSFVQFINAKLIDSTIITLPIFLGLTAAGIAGCVLVSGFNYAPNTLFKLNLGVLNPIKGFGSLFSSRSILTLIVSILKLVVLVIIAYIFLRDKLDTFSDLQWAWSGQILMAIAQLVFGVGIRLSIALLIIATAEALYQKWKYIDDLKMTLQEVKEERKDEEGSPEIKKRILLLQYEMATKRMLQEVPKANVILVNPTHVAVALKYDAKKMDAPLMIAKGADNMCEKIKEIGRAYGIPIIHRPELARNIYANVEPGQTIPEALYVAVAEVLAMIYRLRHRR